MSAPRVWLGGFVAEALDVAIHNDPASAVPVADLVGLAVRRNPKRAHLLVSQVLAKHVPTEPALVMASGELLGAFVAAELYGLDFAQTPGPATAAQLPTELTAAAAQLRAVLALTPGHRDHAIATLATHVAGLHTVVPDAVVLGYAETATGLGRLVANALDAYYIHSTRHATPGIEPVAAFEEGHSHATSHALVPTDPRWLDGTGPVILVDDELSTGSTVINTIRELHALVPHRVYVVAALIDLRGSADRERFDQLGAELGAMIRVTALGTGWIELPDDVLRRGQALVEQLPQASEQPGEGAEQVRGNPAAGNAAVGNPAVATPAGRISMLKLGGAGIPPIRSDRFGNGTPLPAAVIRSIAQRVAGHVAGPAASPADRPQDTAEGVRCEGPITVLGCEENMFLPMAVARDLAELLPTEEVRFSTTTRSPIAPLNRPDYAIASAVTFASHDDTADGPGPRFAYNVRGTGHLNSLNGQPQLRGTIVVFPEPGTDPHALLHSPVAELPGLVTALRACAADVVVVLLDADVPSGTTAPMTARTGPSPQEDAP